MQQPFTNSEGVKRCLTIPNGIPSSQLHYKPQPPFAAGGNLVNRQRPRSAPSRRVGDTKTVSPWRGPSYLPQTDHTNFHVKKRAMGLDITKKSPWAARRAQSYINSTLGYPKLENGHSIPYPAYDSLNDPHLQEYFERKFGLMEYGVVNPRPPSAGRREDKTALYKIAVTTGDRMNAGTSTKVFITVKGNRNKIPKTRLTKRAGSASSKKVAFRFAKGTTHVFKIRGPEIGDVKSIIIETNALKKEEAWFLEEIQVTNVRTKKSWLFLCNQWLSLHHGDGLTNRRIYAEVSSKTEYEVVVVTGDKQSAGTDANVHMTLYGKTGSTPKLHLKNNQRDNFGSGSSSIFNVITTCCGPLTKLRIEHDNTGMEPGWYLERVVITDLRHPHWKYFFPCSKWLARDKGDGAICRTLTGNKDPYAVRKGNRYRVTTFTGNKRGAGTDANVYITMFGDLGDSGEKQLSNTKSQLTRGSKDEFAISCPTVGKMERIRIGHDNSGFGPGWFLDKVIIDDIDNSRVFEFPCCRWLAADEDDHQICRELKVNFGPIDGEIGYPHLITVRTGNVSNAGTNARVYITMYGGKSGNETSGKIWLENGKFSKGKSDIFNVQITKRLSPFAKIEIGHDNSGAAAGWFLDRVVILCRTSGIEQVFICDEWLAKDEGDGSIQRTLYEHSRKTTDPEVTWNLWVHTSEKNVAGTDAKIFVCIYGDKGKSDEIELKGTKDSFEAGKIDNFTISTKDIGKPYKMRVYHDASGIFPGWHLDKVEMENFLSKAHYVFHCGRWLAKDEDDRSIIREMPAEGHKISRPLPLVKYIVEVYTGNRSRAGTNANVYINIFGQLGDTGIRPLKHSKEHIDKFEKGKMDEFVLEAVTLKKLQKIRIGHDGSGPGAGWFLDKVVIRQMGDKQFDTTFECNRWLASDEDDQQLEREITASGSQMLSTTTYHISVKTGNVRNAGTDANVHLKIFGSNGDTGMIELRSNQTSSNKFERGRVDVFKRDATDIGKIKRIRIGHDGSKMGSGWFLDEVVIDIPSRGQRYTFSVHRWLDKSEGDGEIELELEPTISEGREKSIPYEVTVWTGDVSGAGTNSRVFFQMYGNDGKTDEITLANKTDNFERNAVDKFKVEATDVGELRKIRIGHDGTGSFSGWFLEKLLIQRRPRKGTRKIRKRSSDRQARQAMIQQYIDDDDSDTSSLASTPRQKRRSRSARREPELKTVEEEDETYDGEETIDYWFFVKRWFAKSEDDHQIIRELTPTDEHGKPLRNSLEEAEYSIKVVTGDVSGAGTDANVFVNLYGEKGDTGERHLSKSNHMNKFERNQEDIFTIKAIDLGILKKCKIRHDNKGGLAAWFLKSVEVNDKRRKKDYFFPCQRWLATNEDDGQIARDLVPVDLSLRNMLNNKDATGVRDMIALETKAAITTYHIYVKTGDKLGAGTDANVYIVLYGETDNTGPMPLKTSYTNKNKFERNKTDEFVLEAVNIGELKKIKIGHDNAGGGGAWFLDDVRIKAPSLGYSWIFPCNRWLAKDEDDRALERELYPQELATEEYLACIPYEITTFTSDVSGASTSADVYIQLYGKEVVTEKKSLCTKKERKSKFQKGSKDTFVVELEDVGETIEKIRIGHDNTGMGAGWHLDKVEIRKLHSSGKGSIKYTFDCGRWLARNEDDKCIERELTAKNVTQEIVGRDGEMKKKNLKIREQLQSKQYEIKVMTGDVSKAGTDAKVYITVFGNKGDTGERFLHTSETHRDKFERNQTDVFKIEAVDLGKLYKVKIRHDNSLLSPSWYLDKIEIIDLADRDSYIFHCERWLAKNKDDGKIERVIYVKGYDGEMSSTGTIRSGGKYGSVASLDSIPFSKSPRMLRKQFDLDDVTEGPSIPYIVRVSTGDGPDNGTKSNVWINIMGTKKSHTGKHFLDISQKGEFRPGAIDTFSIDAVKIEEIRKIEIGHDGTAPGTGWFLKDVEIEQPTLGKRYHFVCKSWLARDKDSGHTSRIFKVEDGQNSMTSFKPMIVYEVTIETGDINDAGTDSQLTMTVFGSKGTSSPLVLEKADYRFERARKDEITMEIDDVAPLKKIRLTSDGKGSRPDWFCKEVKLRNMSTGQLSIFHCNQWLSKNKDDGKLGRDVPAIENRKKVIDSTNYRLTVKTSDVSGAGTDANVYVKIFGTFGDSGDLHLKSSESNNKRAFDRNQTDVFKIETLDLGELTKLRVWHDNKGLMGSSWHLSYIEVEDISKNRRYTFHCDKLLSKSSEDKQILRELTCGSLAKGADSPGTKDRINYEIEVTTSDKKHAGTAHNVWVILEGSKKESKVFTMENSDRNKVFKRGKSDSFQFRSAPLGKLKYCTVGAVENEDNPLIDPEGRDAQWHCYQISVVDSGSGKRYIFECDDWINIYKRIVKTKGEKLSVRSVEEGAVAVTRGLAPVMYDVLVYTGGESGAGTDANVFITIYGANGDTGKRELKQSFRNLFERNQQDKFQMEALDLGQLTKVTIEHDNSGWKNPAWYLDKIEIVNTASGKTTVFPCQKWLDKKKGDGQISRDLFPQQD